MAGKPAESLRALARACHLLPTVAVTSMITLLGWGMGWPLSRLAGLAAVVLAGQLSVGWSNDAHDAEVDRQASRLDKPVVQGVLEERRLWWLASLLLVASAIGSWMVAGWLGGSFHVLALFAAWAYNLRLSRTTWSWLAYAVAFGSVPAFLSYGMDGGAPPWWMVAVVALIGVSGHLSNAAPDVMRDTDAGVGGLAVRLGADRSSQLCWTLLALASAVLVGVALESFANGSHHVGLLLAAATAAMVNVGAWLWSRRSKRAIFEAALVATLADLCVVLAILRLGD